MHLLEWISVIWLSSYGLLLYLFIGQFVSAGSAFEKQTLMKSKTSKRSYPVLNITASKYVIDDKKAIHVTELEMTDYACGGSRFCHSENSFFNYAASCFECEACRCDEMCRYHGDCCNDVLINGSPGLRESPSPYVSCVPNLEDKKKVNKKQKRSLGLLMVTRCPDASNRDDSSEVRMCETPDLSSLLQATPVWSAASGVTYRNEFCAKCHGLTIGKLERWRVSATCDQSSLFNGASSKEDVWSMMWQSEDCSLNTTAPSSVISRPCRLDLISSCGKTWNKKSDIVERMCAKFTNAVRYGNVWYKNVFCAVCNDTELDRRVICRAPEIHVRKPPVPPLSVLLDFYSKSDSSPAYPGDKAELSQCLQGHIYNPLLERCQKVLCPARRFYNGEQCEKIFETVTGLGYEMSYSMWTTKDLFISKPESILRRYERKLRRRFGKFQPYALVPMKLALMGRKYNEGRSSNRNRVISLDVFVRFVSSCNVSLDRLEEELIKLRQESWTFVKDNLRSTFVPDGSTSKSVGKSEVVNVLSKADPTLVFGKSCKRNDCLQHVHFIPVKGELLCPFIEINITQVQSNVTYQYVNSSIVFSGYLVRLNKSNHRQSGETIQICVSVLKAFHDLQPGVDPDETEKYPKAIISTVCLALSVFCLLLTFIVYSLLPGLRKLPGKNTMALVFHLFMAQLLFLSGIGATSNMTVCRILAITIHYFWLASFSWMFICAYHMYSIFSNLVDNTKGVRRMRNERRRFIQYALFANLSSLVLVVICVVYFLCRTSGAGIGYGGEICFLNTMDAVGVFFAAPLLLILIFNCFFFTRTVISIRRTPNVETATSANRNYVAIYFRLSILLGFGWIFGFLPQTFVIFCIFTVLTAGQGIFIFVSFCANKRTWNMLRQRMQRENPTCACKLATSNNTNSTETASV